MDIKKFLKYLLKYGVVGISALIEILKKCSGNKGKYRHSKPDKPDETQINKQVAEYEQRYGKQDRLSQIEDYENRYGNTPFSRTHSNVDDNQNIEDEINLEPDTENLVNEHIESTQGFVLNCTSQEECDEYIEKLKDISCIEEFLDECSYRYLGEKYKSYIAKYPKELEKAFKNFDYDDVDDEANSTIADKVISAIKKRLSDHLIASFRSINGSDSSEQEKEFYMGIQKAIEDYFKQIGLEKMKINVGDSIRGNEDKFNTITKNTDDINKDYIIDEISLTPYSITYIEDDEEEKIYMEGNCVVFKC